MAMMSTDCQTFILMRTLGRVYRTEYVVLYLSTAASVTPSVFFYLFFYEHSGYFSVCRPKKQ